jgi:hypothetical protein
VNIAVHLKARFAAILHSGYPKHDIIVVDVKEAKAVLRTPVHETFCVLEFSQAPGYPDLAAVTRSELRRRSTRPTPTRPMALVNTFEPTLDLLPYETLPPNVDLKELNSILSCGSRVWWQMDFSREDARDEQELDETIWPSIQGTDHAMPAPIHAAFAFQHRRNRDED